MVATENSGQEVAEVLARAQAKARQVVVVFGAAYDPDTQPQDELDLARANADKDLADLETKIKQVEQHLTSNVADLHVIAQRVPVPRPIPPLSEHHPADIRARVVTLVERIQAMRARADQNVKAAIAEMAKQEAIVRRRLVDQEEQTVRMQGEIKQLCTELDREIPVYEDDTAEILNEGEVPVVGAAPDLPLAQRSLATANALSERAGRRNKWLTDQVGELRVAVRQMRAEIAKKAEEEKDRAERAAAELEKRRDELRARIKEAYRQWRGVPVEDAKYVKPDPVYEYDFFNAGESALQERVAGCVSDADFAVANEKVTEYAMKTRAFANEAAMNKTRIAEEIPAQQSALADTRRKVVGVMGQLNQLDPLYGECEDLQKACDDLDARFLACIDVDDIPSLQNRRNALDARADELVVRARPLSPRPVDVFEPVSFQAGNMDGVPGPVDLPDNDTMSVDPQEVDNTDDEGDEGDLILDDAPAASSSRRAATRTSASVPYDVSENVKTAPLRIVPGTTGTRTPFPPDARIVDRGNKLSKLVNKIGDGKPDGSASVVLVLDGYHDEREFTLASDVEFAYTRGRPPAADKGKYVTDVLLLHPVEEGKTGDEQAAIDFLETRLAQQLPRARRVGVLLYVYPSGTVPSTTVFGRTTANDRHTCTQSYRRPELECVLRDADELRDQKKKKTPKHVDLASSPAKRPSARPAAAAASPVVPSASERASMSTPITAAIAGPSANPRINTAALLRLVAGSKLHNVQSMAVQNFGNDATEDAEECVELTEVESAVGAINVKIFIGADDFKMPSAEKRGLACVSLPPRSMALRGCNFRIVFTSMPTDDPEAIDMMVDQLRLLLVELRAYTLDDNPVTINFRALDTIGATRAAAFFVYRAALMGLRGYNLLPPRDRTMRDFFLALHDAYAQDRSAVRRAFTLVGPAKK